MPEVEERADRLQRAMQGKTQAWLAGRIGVATSSVNGYLQGKVPPADVALRICDVLAIDIRWYLSGQASVAEAGERVVQVPFLDDGARALTFPQGLVAFFGVPSESLCCLSVAGTLMSPGMPPGAEVLATRSFDGIVDGRVYLLGLRGGYAARRLMVRSDGRLLGLCDNPQFRQDVPDEVDYADVAALVLWSSHAP